MIGTRTAGLHHRYWLPPQLKSTRNEVEQTTISIVPVQSTEDNLSPIVSLSSDVASRGVDLSRSASENWSTLVTSWGAMLSSCKVDPPRLPTGRRSATVTFADAASPSVTKLQHVCCALAETVVAYFVGPRSSYRNQMGTETSPTAQIDVKHPRTMLASRLQVAQLCRRTHHRQSVFTMRPPMIGARNVPKEKTSCM